MSSEPRPGGDRLSGPAIFWASTFRLGKRTQEYGLPRWALLTTMIATLIFVASGVALFFAVHSFLVLGVLVGIAFMFDVGVANIADMMRQSGSGPHDPPASPEGL